MIEFLHLLGIIIAFGADIVIATHGVLARKNIQWTKNTIEAHHVTKPLIWAGTITALATWIILLPRDPPYATEKLILFILLIMNGSFLSFYISPRIDVQRGENKRFPKRIQYLTIASMTVSVSLWLTVVWLST